MHGSKFQPEDSTYPISVAESVAVVGSTSMAKDARGTLNERQESNAAQYQPHGNRTSLLVYCLLGRESQLRLRLRSFLQNGVT